MDRKYEITDETAVSSTGEILRRVRALRGFGHVRAGDLGGFIESEQNLSHVGDAWVGDNARVYGAAQEDE